MGKKTKVPDKVASQLQSGEQLPHLVRMLDKQQSLLEDIRAQLPTPLDQHCLHARISGSLLIIHTDSPVWNAKLRFHSPQLIRSLRQQAPKLQRVKIKVLIDPLHNPMQRQANPLSEQSSAHILDMADSVADPELQAALRRLGDRFRGSLSKNR